MPTEGVFAKVIKGGKVKVGDRLEVITEDEHEADTLSPISMNLSMALHMS